MNGTLIIKIKLGMGFSQGIDNFDTFSSAMNQAEKDLIANIRGCCKIHQIVGTHLGLFSCLLDYQPNITRNIPAYQAKTAFTNTLYSKI